MLLTMNKYSVKDAKDIQNSCFKLNSLQLRALLTGYLRADNEPHVPPVTQAECPNTTSATAEICGVAGASLLSRLRRRS